MTESSQHRTRWTRDEIAFLMSEWEADHSEANLAVIAELLGRTEDACRQRWYETKWGSAADPVEVKPEPGAPSISVTIRETRVVTVEWDGELCTGCFQIKSVNGSCGCE